MVYKSSGRDTRAGYNGIPVTSGQHPAPPPKKRRRWWIPVLIVLILALLAGGAVMALRMGLYEKLFPQEPPAPTFAAGNARALTLAPPEDNLTEEGLRAYFTEAADAAREQGFNTLVFEGKQGFIAWWRDDTFDAPAKVAEQDGFFSFSKLDPLAILCEVAGERELQVWLSVDPYDAQTPSGTELAGKAAQHARQQYGSLPETIAADDDAYRALLIDSLAALPKKYPLAAIIFDDKTIVAAPDNEAELAGDKFVDLIGGVAGAIGAEGLLTRTGAAFAPGGSALLIDKAATLASAGQLAYLLPRVASEEGMYATLADWGGIGASVIAVQPEGDPNGNLLFCASNAPGFAGALLGGYPEVLEQPEQLALLTSAMTPAEGTLPVGFTLPEVLEINYPLSYDSIGAAQEMVYVMGTSNPAEPLLMNGEEVPRYTANGSFGIGVPLAEGDNVFTFTNGAARVEHTINRPKPVTPGTTGTTGAMPSDNTREAEPGQAVQIVGGFTGALYDTGDDGAISQTLYDGAVAVVQGSVETTRWDSSRGATVKTWAYRLTSGDYVLARNCVWVGGGASSFTGLSAAPADGGEWITLEGSGTPAAWFSHSGDTLSIRLYDTDFSLPEGFTSELVTSASVEPLDNGVALHLRGAEIWGYQVEYSDGATRIYLNRAPRLSSEPGKPLSGVIVMLDPGHGEGDAGAPGIMGPHGPNEKDVNLAQAQAIAYRLRQLGAEVVMTREDDTINPSVAERLDMLIEQKPDFFIAVHHNSASMEGDRNNAAGLQVYYHTGAENTMPMGRQFGQNIMDECAAATGREASDAAWGYYTVIRSAVCPAVLFEYGFVINPAEFEDIISTDGLYATANATVQGILDSVPA